MQRSCCVAENGNLSQEPKHHSFAAVAKTRPPSHCYRPASMSASQPKLLYCRCAYAQVVPQAVKDGVLAKLCGSRASFETVADLCEMAAHRDPRLKALAE